FWGIHISAVNPQPGQVVARDSERSPLQLSFEDHENSVGFLSRIVNQVQRHECTEKYCLRKEKATGADSTSHMTR
ncbi:hypothetical protein Egran_00011, partial [Elaphomyces granulatus]